MVSCAGKLSGYQQPITDFQKASSIVISHVRTSISEVNKIERDAYIDQQVTKKQQIQLTEIDNTQLLDAEGLQARLDALDNLAKYGELLMMLAHSEAPEKIKQHASDLSKALEGLDKTLSSRTDKQENPNKFIKAVGPVTKLLGEITSLALKEKLGEALDSAVKQGEQPVTALIQVIREEARTAYQLKRDTILERRDTSIQAYKDELQREQADTQKLREQAEHVKAQLNRYDAWPASNPVAALDAMVAAHKALVTYARSEKGPQDLAGLVVAMQDFVAQAKSVGEAIVALR
jgi:hypothetical protein